eukprot:12022263-Ditylum_brightwellii.AAC.1
MEESTQVDASNNDSEGGTSLDNAEDDHDVMNDIEFIQSATIEEIEARKETNGNKPASQNGTMASRPVESRHSDSA